MTLEKLDMCAHHCMFYAGLLKAFTWLTCEYFTAWKKLDVCTGCRSGTIMTQCEVYQGSMHLQID